MRPTQAVIFGNPKVRPTYHNSDSLKLKHNIPQCGNGLVNLQRRNSLYKHQAIFGLMRFYIDIIGSAESLARHNFSRRTLGNNLPAV